MFSSKVILITGSSTGIGAGIAEAFAKEGASLVVTARNEENLKKVAAECKSLGAAEVLIVPTDITIKENMDMLMAKTIEKFGKLDVLVNNAGTLVGKTIRDVTLDEYDKVMNLNIRAPMYMTHLAIPYLEKTKGNIINMSSIYGKIIGSYNIFCYNLSKGHIEWLTKLTALELAKSGIRVNAVNPGYVVTPLVELFAKTMGKELEDVTTMLAPTHPLNQRLVEKKEVSDAVLFLASDKASMITGSSLPIDGGKILSGQ